jgi:hypothetical protein
MNDEDWWERVWGDIDILSNLWKVRMGIYYCAEDCKNLPLIEDWIWKKFESLHVALSHLLEEHQNELGK